MLYAFDIDGTLSRSFLREGDAEHDYDDIEILPDRRDAIHALAGPNARFALITNQAGVAMGYQTPEQVWRKLGGVIAAFGGFHCRPVSLHVCFDHPDAKVAMWKMDPCPRRKPGPGMLIEALEAHHVDPTDAVFVGDMKTDRQAAEAAQVEYYDADEFFS
jgi:D-glycero-D-manno-heptose 1,7-bisphosphate phosphatase